MDQRTVGSRIRWLSDAEYEALEDFDLKSLTQSVGRQFGAALPGAVQGATAGSAAGPWGALIGAAAGGALSLAQKQKSPKPAPAAPAAPVSGPEPAPSEPAAPAAGAAAPVSSSPGAAPTAAGQLGQLLANPLFQQALQGLAAGQGGKAGMSTGGILNLLGALANNAAYEAEAIEGVGDDSYLRNTAGGFRIDPLNPLERARATWDRLFPGGFTTERTSDLAAWLIGSGVATAR